MNLLTWYSQLINEDEFQTNRFKLLINEKKNI